MENYQFYTLLGMLIGGFITTVAGFGWIVVRVDKIGDGLKKEVAETRKELKEDIRSLGDKVQSLESRVSRIEGILQWLEHYFVGAKEN